MMAPKTQKALLVTEVGKPLVLITDRPVPQPGPSQVQIRVTVAGPNPHDQKARDTGLFIAESLPAILTNDVVGKITVLGRNVNQFSIGDRVVGQAGFAPGSTQNGLQEYAVLDADHIAKIPDDFTDDDAATLPTNLLAPLVSLFDASVFGIPAPWTSAASRFDYKGMTLLIIGGGSNCGRYAVQLAALAGIGRIVVVGGDESELKSYGATNIIDRHGSAEEVLDRIRKICGEDLLYAYDAVNPPATQTLGINALSSMRKGKFARLLPTGPIDDSQVQPKKAGYELLNVFGSSHEKPEVGKPFWKHLPQLLLDGKIKPTKYEAVNGWSADQVNEVLDRYRDSKKVVKAQFHLL